MRLAILMLAVSRLSAQPALDDEVKNTRELIAAHRAAVRRLAPVAEATAQVLLKGGLFFLCCGEDSWIDEGDSRSGGPMGIKAARTAGEVTESSVVWVSYNKSTYERVRSEIALMPRSAYVVAFGPKPEALQSEFPHWVDNLTPWEAGNNTALMGNVLSLWSFTGEVAAASARSGKTIVFLQSAWVAGGNARNQLYSGQTLHKRLPKMQSVDPGVLASSYLDAIDTMVAGIAESELPSIRAVGHVVAERAAAGKPARLIVTSHLMSGVAASDNPAFLFEADSGKLAAKLSSEDYLVSLGYSAMDGDLYKAVRRSGAHAVWALASTAKPAGAPAPGDTFLDEHWEPGDAAVTVWGYDVPILPPSGVAQLFLYELILRAAGIAPA